MKGVNNNDIIIVNMLPFPSLIKKNMKNSNNGYR